MLPRRLVVGTAGSVNREGWSAARSADRGPRRHGPSLSSAATAVTPARSPLLAPLYPPSHPRNRTQKKLPMYRSDLIFVFFLGMK